MPAAQPLPPKPAPTTHGLYVWPLWFDLPTWLPQGSWRLGLATGLAGAAAGMLVLRGIRFLFGFGRGIEGLGVGDADLMMMAGAFVGWQVVVVAFFVAVVPALVIGILQIVVRRSQAMPFGPPLAIGVLLALGFWTKLGQYVWWPFNDGVFLAILVGLGAVMLVVIAFILRLIRGTPSAEQA